METTVRKIICIIDDDPLFQYVTSRLLERVVRDYELIQFENGSMALDFFKDSISKPETLPQLIFIDINMPVLNGWGFLEKFQFLKKGSYNPVIYMSSSSVDQDDIEMANGNKLLSGYLIKPMGLIQLSAVISQVYSII